MRKVLTVGVALVAALSLTACNGGAKQAPAAGKTAAAAMPPLKVPASFKDDQEKLAFASKAVEDKYYKEAVPLLEQLMASQPSAQVSSALGTARYNLNDYAGAISAWQKAAEQDPRLEADMENNTGNALRDSNKSGEAEAAYRKALNLDSKEWKAAINLASLLSQQGKISDGVTVLDQAIADNKAVTQLSTLRASLVAQEKQVPEK